MDEIKKPTNPTNGNSKHNPESGQFSGAGNKVEPAVKQNRAKLKEMGFGPSKLKRESGMKNPKLLPGSPNKGSGIPVGMEKTSKPEKDQKELNKMFKQTGQPALGLWEKGNHGDPNQIVMNPKLDKTKEINAKLSEKPKQSLLSERLVDKFNSLSDDEKMNFAYNVYRYGTDSFDSPLGKYKNPKTGKIEYLDVENNNKDMGDYLKNNEDHELEIALKNFDEGDYDENKLLKDLLHESEPYPDYPEKANLDELYEQYLPKEEQIETAKKLNEMGFGPGEENVKKN